MNKILLIDDDKEVLELNKKYFEKEGYLVSIACSAQAGYHLLQTLSPECIILDIMMPDIDGFEACKLFRQKTDIPIIFLTGKVSEDDKINGLLLGADDYITKPYSLRELSARIQVNIRRHQAASKKTTTLSSFDFPPLSINLFTHKAFCNQEEIPLSNREFELLHLLASKPNETVTFEEIGNKIWGYYSENDRRSIMVNASRLRKKLENYAGLQNIIESVWSKGYKLSYRFH